MVMNGQTGDVVAGSRLLPDLTGASIEPPSHVLELIRPHFAARANHVALVDPSGTMTYGDLDDLSANVAARLRDMCVGRDDPVLIHANPSRWAVAAMLGVLRAGAQYVPVDATFPMERQRRVVAASDAKVALVQGDVQRAAPVRAPCQAIVIEECEQPDRLRRAARANAETTHPLAAAYTYFTSGSTGQPKGVTVSVESLAYSTAARLQYYRSPVDCFLLCSSISFDSSVAGIYWTLASGGRLVIPSELPADVLAVAAAAVRHQPSHLLCVPSLYNLLLSDGLADQLGSLRTVILAGETCSPELVRRHAAKLPTARLFNEYGPTECTVWCTVHECTAADADANSVSIGGAIPGALLYVRSSTGEPVRTGEIGELWIGGPGVALGYTQEPADSPYVTVGDTRVYRTGDLVSVRADGELEFHGRNDNQLKIGGVRIELAEIENALTMDQSVTAAAVGVSGRNSTSPALVAFLVPGASGVSVPALRARLRDRLPSVAIPVVFETVAALPAEPNGKLARTTLDRMAAQELRGQPRDDRR